MEHPLLEYYIFRGIFKVVEKKINQINEKNNSAKF